MRTSSIPLVATPLILVPYLFIVPPILALRTWMDPVPTHTIRADVTGSSPEEQAGGAAPEDRANAQSRFTYGIRAI